MTEIVCPNCASENISQIPLWPDSVVNTKCNDCNHEWQQE